MPLLISIVTATYNRHTTVRDSIESLAGQTYTNYEHIIQDGGSTDGTLDVVSALADARTRLVSAPDGGIYDALNKGIERSTGDVVGLVHSDDFFAADTVLEKVARAFQNPAVDGVYGDLQYITPSEPRRIVRHWRAGPYSRAKLKHGWMPPHPTLFLRRDVFEKWGYYDTSYRIAADYDAMLRWLWTGNIKLAYIPEVLVKMRTGGESNRSLGRIITKSREDYRAIRTNGVGGIGTLVWKNLSKTGQFFRRT